MRSLIQRYRCVKLQKQSHQKTGSHRLLTGLQKKQKMFRGFRALARMIFSLYLWDTLSRSLLLIVYSLMPWLLALSLAVIEEVQWYTFVPFFSDFYFFKRLSLPLDQSCAGPSNICRAPFSQLPSLAVSNIDWSRHWKWNPDRGFIGGQRCFQTNHIKEL